MGESDHGDEIAQAVKRVRAAGQQLRICGSGSKKDWLRDPSDADMLSLTEHTGIIAYDPAELVVTVRAGTRLRELTRILQQENQTLACDPPSFYGAGTVGGLVAAGFSGPARPWGGSVRDAVLGVEIVNGLGERLTFGGQVMKNVAGYDVSRLMAGSWVSLGVLLSVSLRVQPMDTHESTSVLSATATQALEWCAKFGRQSLPLTATWWHNGEFYLRLSGSEAALRAGQAVIGGERVDGTSLWSDVRDHKHDFFKSRPLDSTLCRVAVPPTADSGDEETGCSPDQVAIEWRGGLRWLWHEDPQWVSEYARSRGGWSWCRGSSQAVPRNQHLLMRQIKIAFDPDTVFAPALEMVAV